MRAFRTDPDPPTRVPIFQLSVENFIGLLDADIAIVHTQRIRDRHDSDQLPLSMHNSESCEHRSSVSKCSPEWDEKLSFLAKY